MPIGFTLPFSRSTGSLGYFETTSDELSAVGENLKSLLLTNWGERPMHYNLGGNLIEFLFENESVDDLRQRVEDRIISQVSTYMPFVSVDEVQIGFSSDDPGIPDHVMKIRLRYRLTSRPNLSRVLDFGVSGGSSR